MECAEAVALLSEFHESALDEAIIIQVRAHLSMCPPCMDVYVDLETIVIAAGGLRGERDIPFPDETVIWQRMGITKRTVH